MKTLQKTAIPQHWISALFKKFQARYFYKWTAAIEGIEKLAVEEWSERLAGLTGEQIAHGLKAWAEDWPPTSEEFRAYCLDEKLTEHDGAAYKPFKNKALAAPSDKSKGREALKNLKSLV